MLECVREAERVISGNTNMYAFFGSILLFMRC